MKRISNIASRLKEYRDMYNLTLADMERKTGIPAQTINRYELGQRVPKIDVAVSIAESLNVNPLWIQGYDVNVSDKTVFANKNTLSLGENIRLRREELGMTQDELAKKMGYTSRSTIAKIESGENDIPQSKIEHFAKALQTTPAYLMGWEDSQAEPQKTIISDTGRRIKEKRLLAGISIEELAEQSNVSADIITRLETGVPTSFDSKILKGIARVLKTNMDYLAGWSDDGSKLDAPNPLDAIFDMPQQPVAYIHGSDGASKTITDKDMVDLIDKFFELLEKEKKEKN